MASISAWLSVELFATLVILKSFTDELPEGRPAFSRICFPCTDPCPVATISAWSTGRPSTDWEETRLIPASLLGVSVRGILLFCTCCCIAVSAKSSAISIFDKLTSSFCCKRCLTRPISWLAPELVAVAAWSTVASLRKPSMISSAAAACTRLTFAYCLALSLLASLVRLKACKASSTCCSPILCSVISLT